MAVRTIAGILPGGAAIMRARMSSDAAFRLVENHMNSPATTARPSTPTTQTGSAARDGR